MVAVALSDTHFIFLSERIYPSDHDPYPSYALVSYLVPPYAYPSTIVLSSYLAYITAPYDYRASL